MDRLITLPGLKQKICPLGAVSSNINIQVIAVLMFSQLRGSIPKKTSSMNVILKEGVKYERHLEDVGTGIDQSHRHKLQPDPGI